MLKAAQLTRLQLLYIVDVTPCLLNDGRPGLSMTNGGRLIVFPTQCSRGRGSFGQQVIDNLSLALCFVRHDKCCSSSLPLKNFLRLKSHYYICAFWYSFLQFCRVKPIFHLIVPNRAIIGRGK